MVIWYFCITYSIGPFIYLFMFLHLVLFFHMLPFLSLYVLPLPRRNVVVCLSADLWETYWFNFH